jgi:nucleoside-diphosphate-sugar epimerase
MNMAKILITGGAGFIGSNLTEHFLNKGHLNYYGSQVFAQKFELEFMRGFQKVVQKSNKNY